MQFGLTKKNYYHHRPSLTVFQRDAPSHRAISIQQLDLFGRYSFHFVGQISFRFIWLGRYPSFRFNCSFVSFVMNEYSYILFIQIFNEYSLCIRIFNEYSYEYSIDIRLIWQIDGLASIYNSGQSVFVCFGSLKKQKIKDYLLSNAGNHIYILPLPMISQCLY